ncbi:MAG TPA: hypothetical protein VFA19_11940 [Gaiellaceae bacterium]|nr:hypothetical protein [Gaiellaceae bacterium]
MSPTTWRARRPRFARPVFRTLSLTVSLAACSAASGCGDAAGPPAIARSDAAPLVALARRVASDQPCAARRDVRLLERRAAALARSGRLPAELARPLTAAVTSLAADTPPCLSAVPAVTTPPPPAPPRPPAPRRGHGHAHGHGHGRGHGHGKHGGR